MTRAEQRVLRLLALVPYVLQHPGTTVDELVTAFGGTASDLVRDLNTLMMTGTPPFSPGDLVEVEGDVAEVEADEEEEAEPFEEE